MLKFFKTWTLPISMLAGAIGYFVFANVTFLEPTKPFMYTLIAVSYTHLTLPTN